MVNKGGISLAVCLLFLCGCMFNVPPIPGRFNIQCHFTDRSVFVVSNASRVRIPPWAVSFRMNTIKGPTVYLWDNCRAEEIK